MALDSFEDLAGFPPHRPAAGHKGTFGHLGIVAGSLGYHGAAVLAARGAQRARPGLITLLTQPEVYVPIASQLQAVMVRPFDPGAALEDFSAILVGPGLASPQMPAALRHMATRLWTDAEVPVIVDASALDWLPLDQPVPPDSIRVITPHPGEAARLLQSSVPEVQSDRIQAVRQLSERLGGAWVVLKGHQTLVGRATGEVFLNPTGSPDLAQGGSGDVLAGYLAGWLAQPALRELAPTAIRHAVWQHGAAADALSAERDNWVVEDLVKRVGRQACQPLRYSRFTHWLSSGRLVTFMFGPSHSTFFPTPACWARLPSRVNSVSRAPYSKLAAVSVLPAGRRRGSR